MLALLPIKCIMHMTFLQATLAHLESIITDPHGHLAEDPSDEEDPNLNQNDSARILQNGA
jgi:hypothetical protein